MKDCVGQELHIGDHVAASDMNYADLLIGEVIGFTPMKVRIKYKRSSYDYGVIKETLKESYQIIKCQSQANWIRVPGVTPACSNCGGCIEEKYHYKYCPFCGSIMGG